MKNKPKIIIGLLICLILLQILTLIKVCNIDKKIKNQSKSLNTLKIERQA